MRLAQLLNKQFMNTTHPRAAAAEHRGSLLADGLARAHCGRLDSNHFDARWNMYCTYVCVYTVD